MRRLLVIPLALIVLVIATLVWSAGPNGPPADFSFINRGDHKTLDLNQMSWLQDIRVAYALWEGLYTCDPVTLRPVPGVANRIDVDKSGTVYTFHLRDNARWSNGAPVTAGDFLFAWRRELEEPAEYSYLHYYIKGAKDYQTAYTAWMAGTGPKPDFSSVGEKALDSHTFQVTLGKPIPFFKALCAFPAFFPQYEPCMARYARSDDHGRVTSYDEAFTRPPNLVSNGPYYLAEWSFKRRLRMVANPNYWNRGAVKSHIIDEIFIDDPLAEFRAYDSGEVDWLSDVPGSLVGDMLDEGGRPDLHIFPSFGTYFYTFNCQPKLPDGRINPLADVRVRRALTMAIDKEPIVKNVTRAGQPITNDYIPPGVFPGYVSPPGIAMNVAEAQKLLAEAGYPGGRGFPPLSLLFNTEADHAQIAEIIHRQWQQNLGIDVHMDGVEVKVFADRFNKKDFEIARASWYGDYPDPSTFTDKWRSDSDNNEAGWQNAQYDRLCDLATFDRDPAKRLKYFAQAEKILLDNAVILPLFNYVNVYMFRSNVHGLPLDSRLMVMFQSVQVQR
ncbi:MAG TPA: peptide ABC transporter substrate-binding protein [Tepidisphaeraceae bacterium]|nr:peptide ABC transporter substrate-binding protein [Tepidisphaeraceae bacterium]